ncbi:hypothetical protein, partial [Xenorhabdus indica]|uniref:hypothetical protein n=1 Tax=Xenorhabdus indica TaxID=333964 RepID=UPI001CA3ACE8
NSEGMDMTTPMQFAAECKEDYEYYRKRATSYDPRSETRGFYTKLCWLARKNYRKWSSLN